MNEIYAGVGGKARRVTGMYVGVGGVARNVKAGYVGDDAGKARLFYISQAAGVITPDNMTDFDKPAPYRVSARTTRDSWFLAWHAFTTSTELGAGSAGTIDADRRPPDGEWWVQIDLGDRRFADRFRFRNGPLDAYRIWPADFQILGSNDDTAWNDAFTSNKWDVIYDVAGYPNPGGSAWSSLTAISSPNFYRYYRVKVTKGDNTGHTYIHIGQIELSKA
jgi:hypothetical protein